MKILLDTTNKTIKIEDNINLSDLFDELDAIGIDFDEYTIVTTDYKINIVSTPSV